MVYLLRTDDTRVKGRLRRALHLRFARRVRPAGARVGDCPCCLVTLETDGGIDWELLKSELSAAETIVAPRSLPLPPWLASRVVSGERLRHRILLNGALYALEKAAADGCPADAVALFDREGKHGALLERLLTVARTVTVVTRNEGAFTELSGSFASTAGAAPIIARDPSAAAGSAVIIAPDGLSGFGAVELARATFSPFVREGLTVDESCVSAPFSDKMLAEYNVFDLLTAFAGRRLLENVAECVPHSFAGLNKRVPISKTAALFSS